MNEAWKDINHKFLLKKVQGAVLCFLPFLGETSNHETRTPTIFTDEDGSCLDFPVLVCAMDQSIS